MSLLLYILTTELGLIGAHPIFSSNSSVVNSTALQIEVAPGWVSGPNGRGTWSILYGCVCTLIACVYTAIHLNIPPDGESKFAGYIMKVKWILIALFAAEIVVYTAFEQYYLGDKFLKNLLSREQAKDRSKDSSTKPANSDFDRVYAYYVMMGGFAADVSDLHNVIKRVTFTPDGILFLSELGRTPRVEKGEIEDKSKSDHIGKILVCLQVAWSIGQAVERKLAGYPTTMLEVHTIVHVLGAEAGDHSLGLHPPKRWITGVAPEKHCGFKVQSCSSSADALLDVGFSEPTMIMYPETNPSSKVQSTISMRDVDCVANSKDVDLNDIFRAKDSVEVVKRVDRSKEVLNDRPVPCAAESSPIMYVPAIDTEEIVCTLTTGESLATGCGPGLDDRSDKETHRTRYDSRSITVSLTSKDVRRLSLAGAYMSEMKLTPKKRASAKKKKKAQPLFNELVEDTSLGIYKYATCGIEPLLSLRAENFRGKFFNDIPYDATYLSAAIALVPMVYGCAHLGALSIIFPTAIERLLWKISCYYLIAVASSFGLWALIKYFDALISRALKSRATFVERLEARIKNFPYRTDGKTRSLIDGTFSLLHYSKLILLYLGISAYAVARMYLVVESFISLRHVPIGVYQTPELNVMGNIPHL
ncbi:hypothetical protein BGAL_0258g00150 [Botrytis galanthina]|uniref:Uncharacterized protein n=1 Tax=Botrytis galanthina TaxID=278940 RepID=A0A4S8QWC0_9HELO|nr:hypothetical protein BGAL_0258g00150 [Botrytis galanthina]